MKYDFNKNQHGIVVITAAILIFIMGFCIGKYCFGTSNYFKTTKIERNEATEKSLDYLKQLVENKDVSQEQRDKASEEYRALSLKFEQEANLEGKVKALGFKNVVCYLEASRVKVIVKNNSKLNDEESKSVKDTILNESNIKDVEIVVQK